MLEVVAEPILHARAALRRELAGLEKLVRNLAGEDPVCRLLMTMPGVGPVVALTFVSAIDDPERFGRSKDVGPWAGLTPGRNQSGERDIVGAITKAGDAGLRTALYQGATVMLSRGAPNWLKAWALRLATLRGKKRATVALARRIGVVLHRMWRDGTEFRFTREAAMDLRTAKTRPHPGRQQGKEERAVPEGGDPPVSPRRDAVPDDAREPACCRTSILRSSTLSRSALGNRFAPGMTLAAAALTTDGSEGLATDTCGIVFLLEIGTFQSSNPEPEPHGLRDIVHLPRDIQPVAGAEACERRIGSGRSSVENRA